MNLTTYTALFRGLAERHVDVRATAQNGRFLRILISADPVQKQLDLSEFYGALRTRLKVGAGQAFVVLENYQVDYEDNDGDYYARRFQGAFLVLQKVVLSDYDARDAAIGACETIAEDLLAGAIKELRATYRARISVRDAFAEHVGPVGDGHVGVRLNLAWSEPATEELTFNPLKFTS